MSIDELMAEVRAKMIARGIMVENAIPEQFPLPRTLQLSHVGVDGNECLNRLSHRRDDPQPH
jgi:hypothetical protein